MAVVLGFGYTHYRKDFKIQLPVFACTESIDKECYVV